MSGTAAWIASCATMAVLWSIAASWRAEGGALKAAVRGVLGGLAAVATAYGIYGLIDLAAIPLRWELFTRGVWPALGVALAVGVVEEVAKLVGVVLALTSREARNVFRTTVAVAAVFAVIEAALTLPGAGWAVALGRIAFGPVAHAVLSAPFAVALVQTSSGSRSAAAARLVVAIGAAAALHGIGDWSVARPGWGQVGFAAALLVPAFWLYARVRPVASVSPVDARPAGPQGRAGGGIVTRAHPQGARPGGLHTVS